MKKLMMGLVASAVLVLGGAANAECDGPTDQDGCEGYNIRMTVNGNPYFGKWAIVNDRPFVGIEAFSDYMGVPRAHYYKGWSFAKTPSENISPLDLQVLTEEKKVDTIRFAGVTMVDLNQAAQALGVPVHRDLRQKIIQVGTGYSGENMKGAWYRHLDRARGWTDADWMERLHKKRRFEWEPDRGPSNLRRL
jgi:hypothetical protein